VAPFYRWPGGHMGNTLVKTPVNYSEDYGEAVETGIIETVSIDSIGAMPDVIKLDVEGAGAEAIRGGMQTFSKFNPTLVIAINTRRREMSGAIVYVILDFLQDGAIDGSLLFSSASLDASPWLLVLL